MRSRHAITAALALSVVTILTVAACGSSVQGSAQVNTAAAESATSTATTSERTSRTSVAEPTDLSDLSSMLSDLPTDLSVPSDLTDLSFPTELSDLNIPGYSDTCFAVSIAYLAVVSAPFATLGGGAGQYDASELKQALQDLGNGGQVPPELAGDFNTLSQLADKAAGGSLSDAQSVFGSPEFTTASDNISKWVDANCSGS